MSSKSKEDEVKLDVTVGFIVEIIDTAMSRFNLDFESVMRVLDELGYAKLFNNYDVMCVGAADGVEPVMRKFHEYLEHS